MSESEEQSLMYEEYMETIKKLMRLSNRTYEILIGYYTEERIKSLGSYSAFLDDIYSFCPDLGTAKAMAIKVITSKYFSTKTVLK